MAGLRALERSLLFRLPSHLPLQPLLCGAPRPRSPLLGPHHFRLLPELLCDLRAGEVPAERRVRDVVVEGELQASSNPTTANSPLSRPHRYGRLSPAAG